MLLLLTQTLHRHRHTIYGLRVQLRFHQISSKVTMIFYKLLIKIQTILSHDLIHSEENMYRKGVVCSTHKVLASAAHMYLI